MYRYATRGTLPRLRLPAVALAALLLAGCAAAGSRDAAGESNAVVNVTPATLGGPGPFIAVFPVIQGAVNGAVNSPAIVTVQIPADGRLSLPLGELEHRIRPLAKTLQPQLVQAGLSALPEDLRLARVGTFVYDGSSELTEGAGILDQANGDSLVLIYADRAGTITGTLPIGDPGEETQYVFELKIPAAGMHWVRFHATDATHEHMIIDDAPARTILRTESQDSAGLAATSGAHA